MRYITILGMAAWMLAAAAPGPALYWTTSQADNVTSAEVAISTTAVDLRMGGAPLYTAPATDPTGVIGTTVSGLWGSNTLPAGDYRLWVRVSNDWGTSEWSDPLLVRIAKPNKPSNLGCR